jgi:hypothetical protein
MFVKYHSIKVMDSFIENNGASEEEIGKWKVSQ